MANFKVDEPDLVGGDQQVFGAEVAVDQAEPSAVGVIDEVVQNIREVRVDDGQATVVRIEAERIEEGAVVEPSREFYAPPTPRVQCSQQRAAGSCDLRV